MKSKLVIILLIFSQYLYSQINGELLLGVGTSFYKEFSLIKQSKDIKSTSNLLGLNIGGRLYYNKFFGEALFISENYFTSNKITEAHYKRGSLSLGLGKSFDIKKITNFELSLGYVVQYFNINSSLSNSSNVLSSISVTDSKGVLNLNKASHGMYFQLGIETFDKLFVMIMYSLDFTKNDWQSKNGEIATKANDYLNVLTLGLQYRYSIKKK